MGAMEHTNTATAMVAELIMDSGILRREAYALLTGEPRRRSTRDYGIGVEGLAKWGRDLFLEPHFGGLDHCTEWLPMFRTEIKYAGIGMGEAGVARVDWAEVAACVVYHYS